jgi:IclR family acetate operon transcriptional repressor
MKDTTSSSSPDAASGQPRRRQRRTYSMVGVDRTVAVLHALSGREPLGLAEVARRANLDEATALRYLSSLASHDFVTRDEATGRYTLGVGLFVLGQSVAAMQDVRKVALPHMEGLLRDFEETVNVAHHRHGSLVIIDVLESTRSIRRGASVGERDVWHVSALGKAILSSLPEDEAVGILEAYEREAHTSRTKVGIDELREDLRVTRARGYAVDDEEYEQGLRCVGAAVMDRRGRPSYALSISGFAPRMPHEVVERMGEAVAQAADRVSRSLGHIPNQEGAPPS